VTIGGRRGEFLLLSGVCWGEGAEGEFLLLLDEDVLIWLDMKVFVSYTIKIKQ
jgi:hypothetical protein